MRNLLFLLQFREVILPNRILAWTKKTEGGTQSTNSSKSKNSQVEIPLETNQCKSINDGDVTRRR